MFNNEKYRILFILQTLNNLRFNGNFFESNYDFSKKIIDYELKTLIINNIYNFSLFEININNISFIEYNLYLYFLEKIKLIKKCPKLETFFSEEELKLLKEIN